MLGDQIVNPKRKRNTTGVESWYPYYAGFSREFVSTLLDSSELSTNSRIVDPWNGSGTTTSIAFERGLVAYGFDLNPVMVIAAKACLLPSSEKTTLIPLGVEIAERAKIINLRTNNSSDPLLTWFSSIGSEGFRKVEHAIQKILVNEKQINSFHNQFEVDNISSIASFYYVALFRTLRILLSDFKASNPTWIKKPKSPANKLRPSFDLILKTFLKEVRTMAGQLPDRENKGGAVHVGVGSSCASPLPASFADLLITSPPYCTRIDYAVATMPELTLLGFDGERLDELRREMIGTSTVPKDVQNANEGWGPTCLSLLKKISKHESKASHSYYYKNHIQYFDSMHKSLGQISKILKPNGLSILVVQDSYYKNLHNDLPKIITEMSESNGLSFLKRKDFMTSQNMAGINPAIRKYRKSFKATESVLMLSK